jgi:hypothetical protein
MGYPITFQPQLGRGTPVPGAQQGSRDCGPRTGQMGIDGQVNRIVSIPDLRKRMHAPGPQVTNVFDMKRGVESYRFRGRLPMSYTIRTVMSEVRAAVANGRYVHICLDYGMFNALPGRTGDPNFEGGHSVGIRGQRWNARLKRVEWKLYDPLDDHRRPEIPQGPRWVARSKVQKAAEAFARANGRCYAGIFGGGQLRK